MMHNHFFGMMVAAALVALSIAALTEKSIPARAAGRECWSVDLKVDANSFSAPDFTVRGTVCR
jgi:hypothetical protein